MLWKVTHDSFIWLMEPLIVKRTSLIWCEIKPLIFWLKDKLHCVILFYDSLGESKGLKNYFFKIIPSKVKRKFVKWLVKLSDNQVITKLNLNDPDVLTIVYMLPLTCLSQGSECTSTTANIYRRLNGIQ